MSMKNRTDSPSALLSKRTFIVLGALMILPWVGITIWLFSASASFKPSAPPVLSEVDPREGQNKCNPGPWGDLTYSTILIEPPEDQFTVRDRKGYQSIWHFKGYDEAKLAKLWRDAGLSDSEIAILNEPDLMEVDSTSIRITPPDQLIRNLSKKSRAVIYTALSIFIENNEQNSPFKFRTDRLEDWFVESGLKPETIALVKDLLYERGNSMVFSDRNLALANIASADERVRLIKTLARKSTVLVKLWIGPDTDIDALVDYWSRGSHSKDIKPLLESLQRKRTVMSLDLIHLLPPFVRQLLYTYPPPDHPGSRTYMDCHWSSLNFFNATPNPRYEDINLLYEDLVKHYHPITGTPRYGDLIFFYTAKGDVIHSSVYIADNIVFTKNGSSLGSPWILMALDDLIASYPSDQPLDIQRYRRKINYDS